METAVVALGGNALLRRGQAVQDQFKNMERAAPTIERLSWKYRIVLTHGNGPQVGNILLRSGSSMPLHVAVAESEGEIGYIMQQVLQNRLNRVVVSLTTQVLVDSKDSAFKRPTKPIGPFYSYDQAKHLNFLTKKIGSEYRRVVPSPKPLQIVESGAIKNLVKHGFLVIAAGGGGIPVVRKKGKFLGVDAVIDKDAVAAVLAKDVRADALFLLTDVPHVYLNYGTAKQKALHMLNAKDASKYLKQGHFPEGSMGPKVRAALTFLKHNTSGRVVIGSLERSEKGTVITS